jgi:flavodoxin/predicted small lipoprotein YifL
MKKTISIIMAVLLLAALAACGSEPQSEAKGPQASAEEQKETAGPGKAASEGSSAPAGPSQPAAGESKPAGGDRAAASDVLVAYFSATGTTKGVAEKIASITGGELYEIVPAEPYSDADLNWNDRNSRSTKEQNDKSVRPEIGGGDISLEDYKTIYLGFPIWWGEEPRILDTFAEKYSFEGIRVIPFCTSSSSGIGRSGSNMEALAGSGTWLDGKRFGGSVSESELQSWIEGLN